MKKLLFGITSLTLGGAERVLVDIANKLCDKYDITIFTIYAGGELEKELSNKVKLKSLYKMAYNDLGKVQKRLVPLKVLLNKKGIYKKNIKQDYDIEIAFLEGPITRLFSVKNNNTRKIVWVHNDISKVFGKGLKAKLKKKVDQKIYSKYETIVFVSKDNMRKFKEVYNEIRNKYLEPVKKDIIYNYIDKDAVIKKAQENIDTGFDPNTINFVTVARLVPQKAIDRLIKVHAKLVYSNFKHNIYVIGDGPEKHNLENLIKENNVQDTFHLLGKRENPYPYISKADYFCLLSNFEGYGMVLEEAKILGKTIVITDTAAREAVEKYDNSIILENDEENIYKGLKEIIQNHTTHSIKENTFMQYDNSKILKKLEELFDK